LRTDLWGPLVRRWYVVLVGVLLTGAMALTASGSSSEAQYQSGATVVLIPSTTTAGEGGNPLLYLGDLVVARDALVRIMGSPVVTSEITEGEQGSSYSIQVDPDTPGPMMLVTATAASAEATLELRDRVLKQMPKQLRALQIEAGTPRSALITMLPLSKDDQAVGGGGSNKRRLLVVLVAGLGLTVLAAGLIDAWLLARRRQDEHDDNDPETESAGGADQVTSEVAVDDRRGDSTTIS
jgi:hypothetical protein